MKKDWLVHSKIETTNFKKTIDEIVNNETIVDNSIKSTRGLNAKQYMLFDKQHLFLNIQNKVKEELSKILPNFNFVLISAWTVLGEENSYHMVHKHNDPSNHVATVLYLDVPKVKNIHQSGSFYYFLRDINNEIQNYLIEPEIGSLIVMPIHIFHGTYPQSKGLRQTLNMDFKVLPYSL